MIDESTVRSTEHPPVQLVQARVHLAEPSSLPEVVIPNAAFSIEERSDGSAQLVDQDGNGCGLFVNKQLAQQTAAALGPKAQP